MSTLEKRRGNFAAKAWKNILQFLTLSALSFFAVRSVCALDPDRRISQYAHTVWRIQEGLFNSPSVITQTTDGYIWIGTLNGLVRFDGVRFVAWTSPKGQPFPSTTITALLGARDGSLWVGTTSGLSRIKDGELLSYQSGSSGISNVIEDHMGTVWVTRYRVTDGKGPLCQVAAKELKCYGKQDGIPVDYGVALNEDSLGNLWIGSYMLCRWRPGSSSTTYFEEELKNMRGNPGVRDIAAGPSGSIWAALDGVGPKLGVRHYVDGKWISYAVQGFDGSRLRAHALFLDRDKTLWVGSDHGLDRIHDGRADHYGSADGLSGDSVGGIYQDREGNLWVATSQGIDFFRDTPVVSFSMHEGLVTDDSRSVLASADGSVWVGTEGALNVIRGGKVSAITARQGLPGKDVTSMFEDHAHRLWLGVDDKLAVYENGKFVVVNKSDGGAFRSPGGLYAITEDIDHNIWIVTENHNLVRIRDQKVREAVPLNGVRSSEWLEADQKGGIWIASFAEKLAHYHAGHLDIITLGQSVDSLRIRSLLVDSDSSVWAATSNGLFQWKNGRLNVLDKRNGLPCISLFSMVKDKSGALWLYTRCGLLKIAEKELATWQQWPDHKIDVRTFDALDGAQTNISSAQPKATKSLDGRLWFASIVVQMIDPDRLYQNVLPPPVHIEEIVADHKSYEPQEYLRLPPLIHELEIDYTALSFSVPRKVRFRYRLEGKDTHWEEPGTRRQAFYEDLGPGKYRFRVVACNNDGVWNDVGATLDFSIVPAWHQTYWFRILCVVAGILAVWAFYRWRVRQIARAINARFDERLAERTRLARDLHDTLLQTIQGSKMVADDALDQSTDLVRMRRAMERLSEWLGQSMQEVRTALNSLRTSATQVNDLAESLQRATEDCLVTGSMKVSFFVTGAAQEMHPIVRDEIYRIGYEAIRNADLHSGTNRLEVELTYARDLTMRIRDYGRGIDQVVVDRGREGHFGLQGMRERAARIGATLNLVSSANHGTEITLIVPGGMVFRKPSPRAFQKIRTFLKRLGQTSKLD